MTPQEKLCHFMERKYEAMEDILEWHMDRYDVHPITFPDYYDKTDEQSIKSWSNEDAQKVVDKIKEAYKVRKTSDMAMCPFCQYQLIKHNLNFIDLETMCPDCQYKENHGACTEDDSVYALWSDYTPEVYQEIIETSLED